VSGPFARPIAALTPRLTDFRPRANSVAARKIPSEFLAVSLKRRHDFSKTLPVLKRLLARHLEDDQQRGYSAAWFRLKLARASQGTSPIPPDRISRIREVRRQIDLVPQPDRAWILLSLHGDTGGVTNPLVSESELVAQLKSLGHEAMLRLLRKETVSADRSLRPEPANNYAHPGTLFVLRHARELLRTEDADFLLAREQRERLEWWAIAAAELRPANSESILTAAWLRFRAKPEFRS
jgi:hypothetical protein